LPLANTYRDVDAEVDLNLNRRHTDENLDVENANPGSHRGFDDGKWITLRRRDD